MSDEYEAIKGRWERGEGWPPGVHYNVTAESDVKYLLGMVERLLTGLDEAQLRSIEAPAEWGITVTADGEVACDCGVVIITRRQSGLPTTAGMILRAVTDHLPSCRRAGRLTSTA